MLNATIKKLQYKLQSQVLIVNAPAEFEPVLEEWKEMAEIMTEAPKGLCFSLVMIFVKTEKEVGTAAKKYLKSLEPDAVFWMVYPKKSSKKYKAQIHRDSGWTALGVHGFEPVSLVSLDEDWSALRFRKVDYIKTLSRRESMMLSESGKSRKAKK